jgi:single-stranded-DNA-specific exonuclease
MGIDVVVVDHHTVPEAGSAHPAVALVNPLRPDSSFPFHGMASVGLAFYLAASIRTALVEARHFTSERRIPAQRPAARRRHRAARLAAAHELAVAPAQRDM